VKVSCQELHLAAWLLPHCPGRKTLVLIGLCIAGDVHDNNAANTDNVDNEPLVEVKVFHSRREREKYLVFAIEFSHSHLLGDVSGAEHRPISNFTKLFCSSLIKG
jgi:hypothetical protein